MHSRVGLLEDGWIINIAGKDSRLALVETEVCADYTAMEALRREHFDQGRDRWVARIGRRMKTIADERTLNFLSRKAVIPKYGFPVDVVELEVHSTDGQSTGVALQRDLSQAIAEYAPGGKVVANKLEWESCGVKAVAGKAWPVRHYRYNDARNFTQWNEGDGKGPPDERKYLIPEFGFVAPMFKKPSEPQGRARRLYTTRPFFRGFEAQPEVKFIGGVQVTRAVPGVLVILCEGRDRAGFYICRACGRHMAKPQANHKSPSDSDCMGTLERFSLGHELATDVLRLQFPVVHGEWDAYSVAYAILLGAADTLEVPDTDLNVTITGGDRPGESAVVLTTTCQEVPDLWRNWNGKRFSPMCSVLHKIVCEATAGAIRAAMAACGVTAISSRMLDSTGLVRWKSLPCRISRRSDRNGCYKAWCRQTC